MAWDREKTYGTDRLETTMPVSVSWNGTPADVELIDFAGDDLDLPGDLIDEDLNASDVDFEIAGVIHEIPMTDVFTMSQDLSSPELSNANVPGEIDIEELDEHALDFTNLPADARLDPLEE